jgi:DNA-binding IclR family transcriptional regulator
MPPWNKPSNSILFVLKLITYMNYEREQKNLEEDNMVEAGVKSAARAIEVLSYFGRVREPQALKTICEGLKYPQSSTTVLLKTLTRLGYLNYDRVRRVYFPTMKVASLGEWIPASLFGRGEALEIMRDLHHSTMETVVLATRNDLYIQYIAAIESSHPIRFHVDEGSMRLMTVSTIGWLLMSPMKDQEVDNLIRRSNIAAGQAASANMKEVIEQVRLARIRGYSYAENTPFLGGATLCVTLPTLIQGQPVVLACGGVLERMRENRSRYLSLLLKSAKTYSETRSA